MEWTKEKLLQHYKRKEPNLFIQYDGYYMPNGENDLIIPGSLMNPNDEGFNLFSSMTYELIDGANVRLLIKPETPKETVLRLLERLTSWIKEDNFNKPSVIEESKKLKKFKEMRNKIKELTTENNYTLEDLEYLLSTITIIRDKNKLDIPF